MDRVKLTILVSEDLKKELEHLKQTTGASINWTVNKAIQEYLERSED